MLAQIDRTTANDRSGSLLFVLVVQSETGPVSLVALADEALLADGVERAKFG